jgi:NADH dehydrogenase, FAD-containing subunit
MKKLLILGSGAGGTIVAAKMAKSLDEDWQITVIDRDWKHTISPAGCSCPSACIP